jgi:peptidyl-prolyl cis-trans isomerase C
MTRLLVATALSLSLALPAAAQDAEPDASTVVARVGDTEITLGHVIAARSRLPEQFQSVPDAQLYQGVVTQLIRQQALADTVQGELPDGLRYAIENETRGLLAASRIEDLTPPAPTEEEVRAAYEARFADVEEAREFNASHILVESQAEAQVLIADLEDGADFGELARERSTGPSGPNGGQLGWFGEGQMVPAFEEAVAGLEPGDVSEPVETQFGWHVIRLNDRRNVSAPPLEQVRPQIEADLREGAFTAEVERLTEEAGVERLDEGIDPALVGALDLLE